MKAAEIYRADHMLIDPADRWDVRSIPGGGWRLTVHWRDGTEASFEEFGELQRAMNYEPKEMT